LFVTKTVNGALDPADTVEGGNSGVQRSTAALFGSWTTNLATAYPLFETSTVFTVHVPTCAEAPEEGMVIELFWGSDVMSGPS
jgi:hypothetical protein